MNKGIIVQGGSLSIDSIAVGDQASAVQYRTVSSESHAKIADDVSTICEDLKVLILQLGQDRERMDRALACIEEVKEEGRKVMPERQLIERSLHKLTQIFFGVPKMETVLSSLDRLRSLFGL